MDANPPALLLSIPLPANWKPLRLRDGARVDDAGRTEIESVIVGVGEAIKSESSERRHARRIRQVKRLGLRRPSAVGLQCGFEIDYGSIRLCQNGANLSAPGVERSRAP